MAPNVQKENQMNRNKVTEQFCDILRVSFEVTEKINDTYRVRVDQFELVELAMSVQEMFCIMIPSEDMAKLRSRTVREWVDYIHANLPIQMEEAC